MIKKLIKFVVREAYFRLGCHDDDDHARKILITKVDPNTPSDIVIAQIEELLPDNTRVHTAHRFAAGGRSK